MVIGAMLIFMLSGCMEGAKHEAGKPAGTKVEAKTSTQKKKTEPGQVVVQKAEAGPEESVMVEAHLVQVEMEALYKAGVSRVPSSGADNVTAEVLTKCVADANNGSVISAARLVVKRGEEAKTNSQSRKSVKSVHKNFVPSGQPGGTAVETKDVTYRDYNVGSNLSARAEIKKDKQIGIEMNFEYSGFDENRTDEEAPPEISSYSYRDKLIVKDGQAMVVGGVQNGGKGLYLVVRATVME